MHKSLAIARLESLPVRQTVYPKGTKQSYSKAIAKRFCDLLETCDTSVVQLLRDHPELPPWHQIDNWKTANKNGFHTQWKAASHKRAHFLAERCLQLARDVTPKTAHVARVQFDIYRWFAAKTLPDVYGDKPLALPGSTTVNVGVSLSPERLQDIRSKLDSTRTQFAQKSIQNASEPNSQTTNGK